jgi:hypothetical protein
MSDDFDPLGDMLDDDAADPLGGVSDDAADPMAGIADDAGPLGGSGGGAVVATPPPAPEPAPALPEEKLSRAEQRRREQAAKREVERDRRKAKKGGREPTPAEMAAMEAAVSPVATADAIGQAEREEREGEERPVRIVSANPDGYVPGEEVVIAGTGVAYNYTHGPIFIYRGPKSIDAIYHMREPVVVFAEMIPLDELQRLELTRIRGFVFEEGSPSDDEIYNFLNQEKRASVIGCTGAMFFAERSLRAAPGKWVIVDGVMGLVCFCPDEDTLEKFQEVRADGPPERDKSDELTAHFRKMLDAKIDEHERQEAAGTRLKHPHEMTNKEALVIQNDSPGLVMQLLSGLPVPELIEWEKKQKDMGIQF